MGLAWNLLLEVELTAGSRSMCYAANYDEFYQQSADSTMRGRGYRAEEFSALCRGWERFFSDSLRTRSHGDAPTKRVRYVGLRRFNKRATEDMAW